MTTPMLKYLSAIYANDMTAAAEIAVEYFWPDDGRVYVGGFAAGMG